MWKPERLQPKIKGRKEKGSVEWVMGSCFLLFLAILLTAVIQILVFQTASLYMEDALAASNLASAVMDVEEYGISHKVQIEDPQKAFSRYCYALQHNLQLDDNWENSNKAFLAGRVEILTYIIYNVTDTEVEMLTVSKDGTVQSGYGEKGRVVAPDGNLVERTGVYSEITYPVKGMLGVEVQARKGKLVDIVVQEMDLEETGKNMGQSGSNGLQVQNRERKSYGIEKKADTNWCGASKPQQNKNR